MAEIVETTKRQPLTPAMSDIGDGGSSNNGGGNGDKDAQGIVVPPAGSRLCGDLVVPPAQKAFDQTGANERNEESLDAKREERRRDQGSSYMGSGGFRGGLREQEDLKKDNPQSAGGGADVLERQGETANPSRDGLRGGAESAEGRIAAAAESAGEKVQQVAKVVKAGGEATAEALETLIL